MIEMTTTHDPILRIAGLTSAAQASSRFRAEIRSADGPRDPRGSRSSTVQVDRSI